MANNRGGYEPGVTAPTRRAIYDLRRRIGQDGGSGTGPQGPPGAPGVVQQIIAGANVTVDSTNPAYPIVSSTGGSGGTGTDEVWIGTSPPTDPNIELWYDPDAVGPAPPEGGGMGSYIHNQGTPAATWVIVHNLGWYPNVVVEDSGGSTVEGEIVYDSASQLTLMFSGAFSGIAYLS